MKTSTNRAGCCKPPRDHQLYQKELRTGGAERAFHPEALAHCLADLKVQLALRQAMP